MATPRELVSCVAAALNVPVGTVIVHDRNLALSGLRGMAGRGRAVSRVTYQDAANLIIAVAASQNVKDSVKTVLDYVDLEHQTTRCKFKYSLETILSTIANDSESIFTVTLGWGSPVYAFIFEDGHDQDHYFGPEFDVHAPVLGLRHTVSFDQSSLLPVARLVRG